MLCWSFAGVVLHSSPKSCVMMRSSNINQVIKSNPWFLSRNCCNLLKEQKELSEERLSSKTEPRTKVLKVAMIGRPNVGKSSLINQIVGHTTCAVSSKNNTTRTKVKAFVNDGYKQLVFLDSPGLCTPEEWKRYKFEPSYLQNAEEAIREADVLGYVHDASLFQPKFLKIDPVILRLLFLHRSKKSFLVLNKTDAVKKKGNLLNVARVLTGNFPDNVSKLMSKQIDNMSQENLDDIFKDAFSWPHFSEVFMVSALDGDCVGDIKEYLLQEARPGNWLIKDKEDARNPRELAVDLVRAACLDYLPQEIPYQLQYKLKLFEDRDDGCAVEVLVIPKNKRIARIVIRKVALIGRYAQANLSSAFEKSFVLRVNVLEPEEK